jgi:hypothetical protein
VTQQPSLSLGCLVIELYVGLFTLRIVNLYKKEIMHNVSFTTKSLVQIDLIIMNECY